MKYFISLSYPMQTPCLGISLFLQDQILAHFNHTLIWHGGLSQQVDKRIIRMVHKLVGEGIRNVKEKQRALRLYVKTGLFADQELPPLNSRRFFLEERDICNHIYNAMSQLRMSKVDQENVSLLIENQQKNQRDDFFLFRSYGRSAAADSTWHPFYNEHRDNVSEVCLTTVLGSSCNKFDRKIAIDKLKALY